MTGRQKGAKLWVKLFTFDDSLSWLGDSDELKEENRLKNALGNLETSTDNKYIFFYKWLLKKGLKFPMPLAKFNVLEIRKQLMDFSILVPEMMLVAYVYKKQKSEAEYYIFIRHGKDIEGPSESCPMKNNGKPFAMVFNHRK